MKKLTKLFSLFLIGLLLVGQAGEALCACSYAASPIPYQLTDKTVRVGRTIQISSKLDKVTFESGNPEIACVSEDGTVSGKKPGTVIVRLKKKGYKTTTVSVTVKKNKRMPAVLVACDEINVCETLTEDGMELAVTNTGLNKADKIELTYLMRVDGVKKKRMFTVEAVKSGKTKYIDDASLTSENVTDFTLKKLSVYAGECVMEHNFSKDTYKYAYAVPDTTPPEFSGMVGADSHKNGQAFLTVYAGESFAYSDYIKATDDRDGAVKFTVDDSKVDWSKAGIYRLSLTAADTAGNEAETYVEINVRRKNDVIDTMAEQVLERQIHMQASWSDRQKAKAIYKYIRSNYSYVDHSKKNSWEEAAKYGLRNMSGDCFNYYAAARILLTRAGVQNIMIKKVPGYKSQHYWNLVYVDGGWYHYDTTPRKKQAVFCLLTDRQLAAYSRSSGNSHDFNGSLYPKRATKEIEKLIYNRRY